MVQIVHIVIHKIYCLEAQICLQLFLLEYIDDQTVNADIDGREEELLDGRGLNPRNCRSHEENCAQPEGFIWSPDAHVGGEGVLNLRVDPEEDHSLEAGHLGGVEIQQTQPRDNLLEVGDVSENLWRDTARGHHGGQVGGSHVLGTAQDKQLQPRVGDQGLLVLFGEDGEGGEGGGPLAVHQEHSGGGFTNNLGRGCSRGRWGHWAGGGGQEGRAGGGEGGVEGGGSHWGGHGAEGQIWVGGEGVISMKLLDLSPDGGLAGSPLMLDGLLVHPDLDALGESAAAALVPVRLVDLAPAPLPGLAEVLPAPPDGPLEEPGAPVTRKYAVVLPGGEVTAHLAGGVVEDPAGSRRRTRLTFDTCKLGPHRGRQPTVLHFENHPAVRSVRNWRAYIRGVHI